MPQPVSAPSARQLPSFNAAQSNTLAQKLKGLHVPGTPVLLTNVWDPPSAGLALGHPATAALSTASFAIAAINGLDDEDLDIETNLRSVALVANRLAKDGRTPIVPLAADLQHGYGDRLPELIERAVRLGVVGCNLEDAVPGSTPHTPGAAASSAVLVDPAIQVERIGTVLATAARLGVPDFVVNARTDALLLGGSLDEAIARGRRYLAAGATTVFVWGGDRGGGEARGGLRDAEVRALVAAFDGRLNVLYRKTLPDALTVTEIAGLGVARISIGPALWREGNAAVEKELERIVVEAGRG